MSNRENITAWLEIAFPDAPQKEIAEAVEIIETMRTSTPGYVLSRTNRNGALTKMLKYWATRFEKSRVKQVPRCGTEHPDFEYPSSTGDFRDDVWRPVRCTVPMDRHTEWHVGLDKYLSTVRWKD